MGARRRAPSVSRCRRPLAVSPACLVAEVLPGGDAGGLPPRRGREPVHRQPRPADAGPGNRARVRDGRAVPLVGRRRARRSAVHRHRQRGPGVPGRPARQGRAVLRRHRARGARARRRARRRSVRRDLARRADLQGRSVRHGDDLLRARGEVHLGAGSRCAGHAVRGNRRERHIYRIAPDGKGTRFYQTKATHATALAFDRAGNLLVGTESPGRVLRVDPQGKAFVLLDSPFEEIRALRFDDTGMLYVAAISGVPRPASCREGTIDQLIAPPLIRRPAPWRRCRPRSRRSLSSTAAGATGSTPAREERRPARGAVYRIAPDGLWDQLWESREDAPYDLAFDAEGRLIVGTGNKGKIYRLEGDPLQPTLLARPVPSRSPRSTRTPRAACTSRPPIPGKLFRLSSIARAARHVRVRAARRADGGDVGCHQLAGPFPDGSRVEVSTRSGNTETPDDTWSPWSAAYSASERLGDREPQGAVPAVARRAQRQVGQHRS